MYVIFKKQVEVCCEKIYLIIYLFIYFVRKDDSRMYKHSAFCECNTHEVSSDERAHVDDGRAHLEVV